MTTSEDELIKWQIKEILGHLARTGVVKYSKKVNEIGECREKYEFIHEPYEPIVTIILGCLAGVFVYYFSVLFK